MLDTIYKMHYLILVTAIQGMQTYFYFTEEKPRLQNINLLTVSNTLNVISIILEIASLTSHFKADIELIPSYFPSFFI